MKEILNITSIKTNIAIAISCTLLTTGCAGKKPNANLDSARSVYERVSSSDVVNEYSTEDLNVAKLKLDDAVDAWHDKKPKGEINNRAYIAEKYALIAEQRSTLLQHQAQIENGKLERTNAQMDLRANEADAAKREALDMTARAEQLQQEVELREQKLQAQLAEISELKALQAQNTDRGMVLTLGDVLFDTGESTLRAGAINNIEQVARFLKKYPDRTLQIEGHTDSTGDDDFNFNLSTERALAVRSVLQEKGIDGSRIVARGLGENAPIASNSVAEGRQRNRRVEIIFNQTEDTVVSGIDE